MIFIDSPSTSVIRERRWEKRRSSLATGVKACFRYCSPARSSRQRALRPETLQTDISPVSDLSDYLLGEAQTTRVRTACYLCQNFCGLYAHLVDGKVVKLEGDPENPRNHGHLCAKGLSGFLTLYSPTRFTKPLRRTNPKKGLQEDPNWIEISWEEAIETVAREVNRV